MPVSRAAFLPPTTFPHRHHVRISNASTQTRMTAPSLNRPSSDAKDANPSKTARRSLSHLSIPAFDATLSHQTPSHFPLYRRSPTTLQINIGLTCNLACRHCHVESSPRRSETMSSAVVDRLVHLVRRTPSIRTVDITGGAPEMHAMFRRLVLEFSAMGLHIIDRCNLTVLEQPEQHGLFDFLAQHNVRVVASMPCYSPKNVDRQRGNGTFDASIRVLQHLNAAGYARSGSALQLDLVYNPGGASLPPPQEVLESDYKRELKRVFGIDFSNLICITNMPIKRFADDLVVAENMEQYMQLLLDSFNPATVDSLMCLDMVHVAWDGRFSDCDFNYALDIALPSTIGKSQSGTGLSVFDVESFDELAGRRILTGKHCYGCTAGSGSSCGGSLA